ncbi:hypothetical protein [Mycobacterium sp. URHB0021]
MLLLGATRQFRITLRGLQAALLDLPHDGADREERAHQRRRTRDPPEVLDDQSDHEQDDEDDREAATPIRSTPCPHGAKIRRGTDIRERRCGLVGAPGPHSRRAHRRGERLERCGDHAA